jgi:DNA-binding NtrC family response regulator
VAHPRNSRTVVLLVPDEQSRAVCSVALQHGGYTVVVADDAADVLARARDNQSELVVADISVEQRAALRAELAENLPGVTCLFVRPRHAKGQFKRFQVTHGNIREQSPPHN